MCARSKIEEGETVSPVESKYQSALKLKRQKRKAIEQHQALLKRTALVENAAVIKQDLLAVSTDYYRLFVCACTDFLARCQDSKAYRILFCTTQPAHMVTLIAVTTIATLVCPRDKRSDPVQEAIRPSPLTHLIYLAAFMMHFGAQMWMTFVSGLSLYFAVPRHTFGEVQKVLFPKYFGINCFLSLVTLSVFIQLHPSSTWDCHTAVQVAVMVVCFLLELLIRLYLTPPLLRLIAAKNAMETAAGVGLEVGKHDPGPLIHCPHYVKIHCMFRKVHMTVAIGNILTMACTVIHLHYLANKICML